MTRPSDAVARFGLICEDKTDAEALEVLVRRIASGSVGLRSRSGEGCGNLRKKAGIWARDLVETGYDVIIVVHDLDRNRTTNQLNDPDVLRGQLEAIEMPHSAFGVHICIPIEELEAWFFACPIVMKKVSGKDNQTHSNPQAIPRPKERLQQLSRGANRKPRYSTNDNVVLASMLDLDACARSCPSFRDFRDFVRQHGTPH